MNSILMNIKFYEMDLSKSRCLSSECSKNSKFTALCSTPLVVNSGITRHFLLLTFQNLSFKSRR